MFISSATIIFRKSSHAAHHGFIVSLVCAGLGFFTLPVFADDYITEYIPNAKAVGEARHSRYLWDIYDAVLIAPEGEFNTAQPAAIKLSYLQKINRKKFINGIIDQIRNQGMTDEIRLADWHTQMCAIMPSEIDNQTELTTILTNHNETIFFNNGHKSGMIRDPEFGKHFLNIWLGANTGTPDIRNQLLGQK